MAACIVCQGSPLDVFLDLGRMPLANRFLSTEQLDEPEPTYPLRVAHCDDCGHVQLVDRVPPVEMFSDYLYISSVSSTLKNHLHDLARLLSERYSLDDGDLVIDIGANDGSLLQGFAAARMERRPAGHASGAGGADDRAASGVRLLGVDPATNLRALAEEKGVPVLNDFFGESCAERLVSAHGQAKVITATNTFPHIPDLADFMRGIDLALRGDGVFVIEAHYLLDMIDQNAFDTIYHEHVSYWSLTALNRLFAKYGFVVTKAERVPLHHGQLRVAVQRKGSVSLDDSVEQLLELEQERQLNEIDTCRRFAEETRNLKQDLLALLNGLRQRGDRVVGYGAPAKGNTLLSFLELGVETLPFIADRSPLKQGRFTPGARIPVVSPQRITDERPDYVLILAWNFADEIISQLSQFRAAGGKFILPVPSVKVIE